MGATVSSKERHVIPRWRDSNITAALGELDPANVQIRPFAGEDESWIEKLEAWKRNPQLAFAADLVGAALTLGRFEQADAAARFILANKNDATFALQHVAGRVLGKGNVPDIPTQPKFERDSLSATVRVARSRLRVDPRNAIAWTDIARAYASLGQSDKAKRAVELAVALSRDNRFILRSAARLFLHLDDSARAHHLLRDNDIVRSDPWIVAAEIAAADIEDKTSRLVKRGRDFLTSKNFAPFHVAELACAIGSLELKAGRSKAAKKLFQLALINPTENSLAQIEWASQQLRDFTLFPAQFEIPFSHEAKALYSFAANDWERAVSESIDWFADEPFSSKSATLGSYIAAEHLDNFELSRELAERGLIASPNHPTLLNNLAFALANLGQLEAAATALNRIDVATAPTATQVCYYATKGFIAFRAGDVQSGRVSYDDAIKLAKDQSLARLRAHAAINLAQEELRARLGSGRAAVLRSIEYSKIAGADANLRAVLERLKKIVIANSDSLGDIDRIVEDVSSLMKPSKQPLIVETRPTQPAVPLM